MPPINYLAVLVCGVAAFLLGGLWYSPALFAKSWMAAHGYTPEQMPEIRKKAGRAYGVSVACLLVTALVLAIVSSNLGIMSAGDGAKLGALVWLGFAATTGLMANMYSNKPLAAWVIDTGYQLVYLVLMGVILAVWM